MYVIFSQIVYEIRLASQETGELSSQEQDNYIFRLTKGDYSPLMGRVAHHLSNALPHVANQVQADMLQAYIKSFTTGSLQVRKKEIRKLLCHKIDLT